MVLKKTITDDEMLEIAAHILNERFSGLDKGDVLIMGMYVAAIAAEIFADGEEVLSTKITDQYIVGSYKYYVTTGGDISDEYSLVIQRDADMISRSTFPTEAQALKFIIKHAAIHNK